MILDCLHLCWIRRSAPEIASKDRKLLWARRELALTACVLDISSDARVNYSIVERAGASVYHNFSTTLVIGITVTGCDLHNPDEMG